MRSVTRLITFVLVSLLAKGDCTPYPNKTQIATIFSDLGTNAGYAKFITTVVEPNVTWTLMGTHPLAGVYHNAFVFLNDTVLRLYQTLDHSKEGRLDLLDPIIGGGQEEWSVQQLHGLGTFKNGLPYDNRFAWVTRWNKQGKIEEVITYFDSALVARGITENEAPTYNYTSDRSAVVRGPVGANCGI